ncbi:MAG: hypothetical protein WD009_03255 [Phycisphaeraceae bacterium]
MNQAAPPAAPTVVGRLEEKTDERIVLAVEGTDYRLHLVPAGPIDAAVGARVRGVVRIEARRVDVVPAGGWFIEPVFGRPRRVQGRIVGGDVAANELHLKAGTGLVVKLEPAQSAGDFAVGQMVSFDVKAGATFEVV